MYLKSSLTQITNVPFMQEKFYGLKQCGINLMGNLSWGGGRENNFVRKRLYRE